MGAAAIRAVSAMPRRLVAGVAVGVLDRDEGGGRLVRVAGVAEGGRDLDRIEGPVRAVAQLQDAGPDDDRVTRGLVPDDVALGAGDDLAAARHVGHQRHQVAHRPRRDEQPASLPSSSAARSSERVDGRVLAPDVVADLGRGHRPAHLGGRAGHGVGTEVDECHGGGV